MAVSEVSVLFAEALNAKFPDYQFDVIAGRRFDKVVQSDRRYGRGGQSVHAFVEKANGDLIKAATWAAPQKNPETGALAVRFNLTDEKSREAVVAVADAHGSYLYVR